MATPGRRAVVPVSFAPSADRRSVLDRAHRGDIEGALGTVRSHETGPQRTWRSRAGVLLAVMGPGVIVMVADNDAGGVSVYAQAGHEFGFSLVWLLLALAPVLYVVQEMVARLGAVTGAGHARLIFERFGPRWGAFALGDLLLINLLTIVTEFIGVSLALGYFGISRLIAVPTAAIALIAVTAAGRFRRWELVMWSLVLVSLIVAPLAAISSFAHVPAQTIYEPRSVVELPGGIVLLVVAMIGTTVAPWQLFFQQSSVVDKRITARWLAYERVDLAIGAVLFALGAVAVLVIAAVLGVGNHSDVTDGSRVAQALHDRIGWWAGAGFAIALLNGSVLGAAAVTLSTSYALGDVYGVKHSLHRGWRDAPIFHGTFALSLIVSAAFVLIPNVPLGAVTVAVQVLAGVLLPSATVFLLLLSNDRDLLGPRTNPRWLNTIAVVVVTLLIDMSFLLTLTTLFPGLNVAVAAELVLLCSVVAVLALLAAQLRTAKATPVDWSLWERLFWTMPRLESLPKPKPSAARTTGLVVLRVYLAAALVLVVARLAQSLS